MIIFKFGDYNRPQRLSLYDSEIGPRGRYKEDGAWCPDSPPFLDSKTQIFSHHLKYFGWETPLPLLKSV